MKKTAKFNQSGGGIFFNAFKAMLGVYAAGLVYGLFILFVIAGFIGGVFLFLSAKDDLCNKKETQQQTRTRTVGGHRVNDRQVGGRTETYTQDVEVCVDESSVSDGSGATKGKYYGGIVMMVIFGLLLLIILLPAIIDGVGWAIGSGIGSYSMDYLMD